MRRVDAGSRIQRAYSLPTEPQCINGMRASTFRGHWKFRHFLMPNARRLWANLTVRNSGVPFFLFRELTPYALWRAGVAWPLVKLETTEATRLLPPERFGNPDSFRLQAANESESTGRISVAIFTGLISTLIVGSDNPVAAGGLCCI